MLSTSWPKHLHLVQKYSDFAWNMLFAPWYSTHDRKHSGDQHCWTLSGTCRIYCFGQGPDAEFYLSSADLMSRNLNRRIEIACPIQDKEIKRQLDWILHTQLEDNVKASELLPDGSYLKNKTANIH